VSAAKNAGVTFLPFLLVKTIFYVLVRKIQKRTIFLFPFGATVYTPFAETGQVVYNNQREKIPLLNKYRISLKTDHELYTQS
jgi:hypothetical protein